jgi:hypothetical protein
MSQQTYEEAARDYLAIFSDLTQQPLDVDSVTGQGEMPSEFLLKRADEIAGISASMIPLGRAYFDSADPAVRDGIYRHFIDQATVELLFGTELMHRAEARGNGPALPAAERATQNAALREAISAVKESISMRVGQGFPASMPHRITESADPDEAAAELTSAITSTSAGISRRVQEIGADIVFDLVHRTEWDEAARGVRLSDREVIGVWNDDQNPAGKLVLNAYRKIAAVTDTNVEAEVREWIEEWLHHVKQGVEIRSFDALLRKPSPQGGGQNSIRGAGAAFEIIKQTSDLIKSVFDRFIVLTGRMRKLGDAIRLSKAIKLPRWTQTMVVLQVTLLSALLSTGRRCIHDRVEGILRERGFATEPRA